LFSISLDEFKKLIPSITDDIAKKKSENAKNTIIDD
jgi:hypothetical protein